MTTILPRQPLTQEIEARKHLETLGRSVWGEVFERVQIAETPPNLQEPGAENRYLCILLMRPGTDGSTVAPKPLQRITKGRTAMIALQRMYENVDEVRRRVAA